MTNQQRSEVSASELRTFGFIFGGLVIALFGLIIPFFADSLWQQRWPWMLGGGVWLLAVSWPPGLKPLYRAWMKFGDIAGFINTRIILLLLFYVVVLPVGLVMRLFGVDPMRRKVDPQSSSYRIVCSATGINHMEKPY